MTVAKQYADWVLSPDNKFRTGKLIKMAAERFLSDLKRTDIYFDESEAVKWVNFMERYCNQWEGKWRGKPLILEPWQKFHLEQLAGWIRIDTGFRRFTKFYLQISKKNGKSTECAGIALNHIFADHIDTPKVYTAANNEDQAKICVNMAGRMIEQSPDLYQYVEDDEVKLSTYGKNITEVIHKTRDGFITALSKEGGDKKAKTAGGKHGINASLGLVDEFGMSPDHGASGSVYTSMAARDERLMAYLTTAGFNMNGPCYSELRDQGVKVLNGTLTMDNYLPIIYELDKPISADGKETEITIDYLLNHEEVWQQSNPNLGVSVNKEYLREMLLNAASLGGTTEVDVKTLNFNMWVDSPEVFIPSEVWNSNIHGISEADLLGEVCYGGIELVSSKLMNCFCLLFPDVQGKTIIKPIFWMPEENKNSQETDQYKNWVSEGLVTTFLGNVSDNDKVYALIMAELSKYNMHSFSFKTNLLNNDVVQSLIKNGIQGNPISHGYQGISTPTLKWEELLTAHEIEHFNNPVLAWMNSNCMAVRKDNDIRLEKSGSKVVGIYAAINALAQWKSIEALEQNDKVITSW